MKKKSEQYKEILAVNNLSHKFGREEVISHIDLKIGEGECIALVGPSGCGKTTLLRICSGLLDPEQGTVRRSKMRIGYVFQTPRLLPWEKAGKNMMLGLRARGKSDYEYAEKLKQISSYLGLTEDDLDKYPHQLSGGMQSRVALGRALAIEPNLLFLDEPFTGLDIGLKRELIQVLRDTLINNTSIFLITHELSDAVALAQKIMVMHGKPGRIALNYHINHPLKKRTPSFVHQELNALLKKKEISAAYNLKGLSV